MRERVFVGTGLFWGLIIGVLLAVAVVILAAQNTDRINVSFLGWDFSTPLIAVVLGALLIGVVVDELFGLVYRKRRRRTLRERDELQRLR
ncbi:MAG TPA: lipopolysaccharide assembly protein LapA domain-containing protein [Acidimicrobiia bacterium]|nr:lipopolysaccharide assembly protein LapA domain-containing protein [Acidimicrobiia bacterium]